MCTQKQNSQLIQRNYLNKWLTKRLRVIRNAWHFYCALSLVVKLQCRSCCIALLTP
ncbi:DUF3265 domain-containing protein [Vibrio parahaemolyticus]